MSEPWQLNLIEEAAKKLGSRFPCKFYPGDTINLTYSVTIEMGKVFKVFETEDEMIAFFKETYLSNQKDIVVRVKMK